MTPAPPRIEVMHGVNLNMLGRRDPELYGTLDLAQLERRIGEFAAELDLQASFFQTNSEAEYVERLHGVCGSSQAIILNPGAWTHYAWAIRDALEIAALPAAEVHLSDVKSREPWRRLSVIEDLCVGTFCGRGVNGYRDALRCLRDELAG
jgi:3-dehydroquinate dehydratase-2